MAGSGMQLEKATVTPLAPPAFLSTAVRTASQVQALWMSWPASRRNKIMLAMVAGGLAAALTLWLALRTDWAMLYSGLDSDDARAATLILTQDQIPFDLGENGTIRVPAPMLDKARLATSAKGSFKTGRLGFELFDKPNWIGSEFDERVNYQRALEGELEHTIATLNDIESARVHLVLPQDSLFRDEARPAKASVVLKLRHASLGDGEDASIRNLVASAVDGLTADHIALVDAAGNLPLGPKTPEMLRIGAEKKLEEKLIGTLEPVAGPANVRASVTLDYDDSVTDETNETYDPSQSATLSMQRAEQASGGQSQAGGVPGTASNSPNTASLPVFPKLTTSPETSKSEAATYGVSKTVEHVSRSSGRIRRMTVAIVVNHRPVHPSSGKGDIHWEAWSPDALRSMSALAQAAVGFDASRGDVLTVQNMLFDQDQQTPARSGVANAVAMVTSSPLLVKYIGVLCALIILVGFVARPALRLAAGAFEESKLQQSLDVSVGLQKELPPSVPNAQKGVMARQQEIADQVKTHMKREPERSSQLLQSWIHSEEVSPSGAGWTRERQR